jgi:hypothetical protein
VPPQPGQMAPGNPLSSVGGVFDIPADQSIQISPPDPQRVGQGNAAYRENVGGLLLEDSAGNLEFLPQWTAQGYNQELISLEPGESERIIYALVPQQEGQRLQLGQRYGVTDTPDGYQITAGSMRLIAADRQPQNFAQEMVEVYAVEDTLPGPNAVTALFNGIQGVYVEAVGGEPVPTVDLTLPEEVDARVGNRLVPIAWIPPEPGQRPYSQTTVAAGLYLNGSFTGGLGNQRDTVTRTTTTLNQAADEVHTRRTIQTFATPQTLHDTFLVAATERIVEQGITSFDINRQGELTNVAFIPGGLQDHQISRVVLEHTSELLRGEEFLQSSVSEDSVQLLPPRLTLVGQDTSTEQDSYPNFSPVQGEVALGAVLNFGHTPWSPAANTVRAEVFVQEVIFGRGDGAETGWRAELVVHPFGEKQGAAFQYNEAGQVVPVYQTEPLLDADGTQVLHTLAGEDGTAVAVLAHQFLLDQAGDPMAQMVGTGQPRGPGLYLRVEDVFSGDSATRLAGGIQFDF